MSDLLRQLLDGASRAAREIATRKPKTFATVFMAMTTDDEFVIEGVWRSEREKVLVLAAIRRLFAERQVIAYAMVTEAWASQMAGAPPSRQPDRLEIVYIVAADAQDAITKSYLIDRDADGLVDRLVEYGGTMDARGRLAELLRI